MAKPEQIPTDLTLELAGNLSPERFLTAARSFFGCVQEIGRAVTPEGNVPGWRVLTREGSNLLGLEPEPDVSPQIAKAVYSNVRRGIEQVADAKFFMEFSGHSPWRPILTEAAIQHLKTLADLAVTKSRRNPVAVRVWVEKQPTEIGQQISKAIADSWGEDYRDFGTVEGKLDAIQDRTNLQIRVYDQVLRQAVVCHVKDDMLAEVFEKFRKRVEVAGIVHYRRNGSPISIDVEHIEELPDDSELPSIGEVRGILRL